MKPIAEVVWDDAHGNSDMFNDVDVDHKPYRFTTIGYLIRSDEKGISLSREFTEEDSKNRDHRFIPRQMVVSERIIKNPKPRVKRTKEAQSGRRRNAEGAGSDGKGAGGAQD